MKANFNVTGSTRKELVGIIGNTVGMKPVYKFMPTCAYTIGGIMFGLAGFLECARTGGATSAYGLSYEFDAISACVVGGVSNTGGVGTVPGMVIGVLVFGVINYGRTFIGVNPYWQQIIKGIIIIVAVGLDMSKNRKRK